MVKFQWEPILEARQRKGGNLRMTDDEVKDLLIRISSQRYAAWQKGELDLAVSADLPKGIEGNISEGLWYVGVKGASEALIAAGATTEQAANAIIDHKNLLGIIEPSDLVLIPTGIAEKISRDLMKSLLDEPDNSPRRLDEVWVKCIKELRVEIYFNEGQHRGRPHVAVVLPDGKVSVSLEDPPVLLTPHGYRGEASALKVVKENLLLLRKLWDETRPDDQKLPSRQKAAIVRPKGRGKKRGH